MRLSKKYGGIQFFAPIPGRLQINFDSHVISVSGALYNGVVKTITTSGAAITGAAKNGDEYIFDVILENGYIIDTATLLSGDDENEYGEITSKTDTSFGITAGVGGIDQTITLTSKQRGVGGSTMIDIDLTTLSGYDNLAAGTYNIGVKALATGYQDSDLSETVSFTKLAAPTITVADTTITWDAIENAESYDVYVDGELYENTTGGVTEYTVTIPGITRGDSGYGFYSIDDGATWVDMFKSTATTVKAKTIKFKAVGDDWWNCAISSETLGVSLAPYHKTQISDNYTLTQDITDLHVYYLPQ